MLGLPQRLPLHRSQTLVTSHQRRELLLQRERREWKFECANLAQMEVGNCDTTYQIPRLPQHVVAGEGSLKKSSVDSGMIGFEQR